MIRSPLLFPLFLVTTALAAPCIALEDVAKTIAKDMPAGSIATAELVGGEPVYAMAGKAEPAGVPPEKALYEIGSITKVFTALLLAQAVVEQRVTLETTVRELTGNRLKFVDAHVGAITLRQLATHTSGLPRLPDNLALGANKDDPYVHYDRKLLDGYLTTAKLGEVKADEVDYSNLGFGLLGDLLARRYDKPWTELIREKITGPLNMNDTVAALSEEQQKRLAPPYEGKEGAHSWNFTALAGAGALRSTLSDMVLFGKAFIDPPKNTLGDAIKLMMQPQVTGGIGLAISIGKIDGRTVYSHLGGTGGYRSSFEVTPEQRIVRVILINNAALDAGVVSIAARGEKPRKENSARVLTPDQLTEYEGVYELGKSVKLTVVKNEKQLMTQLTGQAYLNLFPHEEPDRFFLKVVAAELFFTRENGKITSVTLHQNGMDQKARRLDEVPPKIIFHTDAELRPYEGTYDGGGPLKFTVLVRSGTLFVKLEGQQFAPVFERRSNWWTYDVVSASIEFARDDKGKVRSLTLHQNGQNIIVPKK